MGVRSRPGEPGRCPKCTGPDDHGANHRTRAPERAPRRPPPRCRTDRSATVEPRRSVTRIRRPGRPLRAGHRSQKAAAVRSPQARPTDASPKRCSADSVLGSRPVTVADDRGFSLRWGWFVHRLRTTSAVFHRSWSCGRRGPGERARSIHDASQLRRSPSSRARFRSWIRTGFCPGSCPGPRSGCCPEFRPRVRPGELPRFRARPRTPSRRRAPPSSRAPAAADAPAGRRAAGRARHRSGVPAP